jgi:hypothetical protein
MGLSRSGRLRNALAPWEWSAVRRGIPFAMLTLAGGEPSS